MEEFQEYRVFEVGRREIKCKKNIFDVQLKAKEAEVSAKHLKDEDEEIEILQKRMGNLENDIRISHVECQEHLENCVKELQEYHISEEEQREKKLIKCKKHISDIRSKVKEAARQLKDEIEILQKRIGNLENEIRTLRLECQVQLKDKDVKIYILQKNMGNLENENLFLKNKNRHLKHEESDASGGYLDT